MRMVMVNMRILAVRINEGVSSTWGPNPCKGSDLTGEPKTNPSMEPDQLIHTNSPM